MEIQSLKILLNKVLGTKINKQIIVVDDFSSDGSRELLINQFKDKINKLILHKKNLIQRSGYYKCKKLY